MQGTSTMAIVNVEIPRGYFGGDTYSFQQFVDQRKITVLNETGADCVVMHIHTRRHWNPSSNPKISVAVKKSAKTRQ